MASLLESRSTFESKAKELGLSAALIAKLTDKGVSSLGMFAFVTSYTLGSSDDSPLTALAADLKAGTVGTAASYTLT